MWSFALIRPLNIHVSIGKASFDADKLHENIMPREWTPLKRPVWQARECHIQRATVTTSMGPGMQVDPNERAEDVE